MATNAENIALTMQRLGSRSSPTLRAQILAEMNKAIRELERGPTKPWFMESRLTGVLVVGQDYIEQPATFLGEHEEGSLRLRDISTTPSKWGALTKEDYDAIQYKAENCDPGKPCAYALMGTRVYFDREADLAYPYRWEAMVRTTLIVDNTVESTNPWLTEFFDLISLSAAMKVARLHIKSAELAAELRPELDQARDSFWRECESRQQVNRNYEQE